MKHDSLRITFEGTEADEVYRDLLRLEVELDEELAGMFRITLALPLGSDGSRPYLDDERFALWRRVVITGGPEDDPQDLITGYITHLRPKFGAAPEHCRLEIWGMDASVLLDREERVRDWPNKKDSDIATEVFDTYGLTPRVTDTDLVHTEEGSTIIQRETDIQLLRRLALRNGFECYVDGDTGHFGPPAVDAAPQPVLAVQFGDETNVDRFHLEADALTPAEVVMSQIDHDSGEILQAAARTGRQPALGADRDSARRGPRGEPGRVRVGSTVTTGAAEMTALCQGLFDLGEWFVTAEGEIAANAYDTVLRARGTVLVKGVGETHSGVYYVSHVTHRFTADGYVQSFRVKRNALGPTGDEDFSGGAGLPGVPAGGL